MVKFLGSCAGRCKTEFKMTVGVDSTIQLARRIRRNAGVTLHGLLLRLQDLPLLHLQDLPLRHPPDLLLRHQRSHQLRYLLSPHPTHQARHRAFYHRAIQPIRLLAPPHISSIPCWRRMRHPSMGKSIVSFEKKKNRKCRRCMVTNSNRGLSWFCCLVCRYGCCNRIIV